MNEAVPGDPVIDREFVQDAHVLLDVFSNFEAKVIDYDVRKNLDAESLRVAEDALTLIQSKCVALILRIARQLVVRDEQGTKSRVSKLEGRVGVLEAREETNVANRRGE
jgi:hypothetical protein